LRKYRVKALVNHGSWVTWVMGQELNGSLGSWVTLSDLLCLQLWPNGWMDQDATW